MIVGKVFMTMLNELMLSSEVTNIPLLFAVSKSQNSI